LLSTLDCAVAEVVDVDDYIRVLCNLTSVSKGKGLVSGDDECVVGVKEADESELIDKRVSSIGVAFEVYNEYAFRKDFSIKCDKLRRREGSQEVRLREFCCSK